MICVSLLCLTLLTTKSYNLICRYMYLYADLVVHQRAHVLWQCSQHQLHLLRNTFHSTSHPPPPPPPGHSYLTEVLNISDMTPDVTDVFDPISVDNDADWLAQWSQLLDKMPPTVHVPCDAAPHLWFFQRGGTFSLLTPIHFFLQGILHWFWSPLFNPQIIENLKNMKSALQHTEVIDNYLAKEAQERSIYPKYGTECT